MEFWLIWIVGIILTIFTAITIRKKTNIPVWMFYILVSLCVIIVGGIANAKFIGMFFSSNDAPITHWIEVLILVVFFAIPIGLTYLVGSIIIGIYYFEEKWAEPYFIVLLIISTICWTFPIIEYNKDIEYLDQTVVLQTEERQLYYFCNIPVQSISGSISGHSTFGTGSINGTISTTDVLSYWYANEDGIAIYGSAQAENSSIIFIDDSQSPYVEIINYRNQKTTVNHNNGMEKVEVIADWAQYNFYLPEEIMQYNLE